MAVGQPDVVLHPLLQAHWTRTGIIRICDQATNISADGVLICFQPTPDDDGRVRRNCSGPWPMGTSTFSGSIVF